MKFLSRKPKINISTRDFYYFAAVLVVMELVNAAFLGLSMRTTELLKEVGRTGNSYTAVKWSVIGNYLAFSFVMIVFIIHTVLARNKIKIGYVYTNLWNLLFMSVVLIPIVLNPDFSDYRIWINLALFFAWAAVMFRVYKDVFTYRRMKGYWIKSNGGMEW